MLLIFQKQKHSGLKPNAGELRKNIEVPMLKLLKSNNNIIDNPPGSCNKCLQNLWFRSSKILQNNSTGGLNNGTAYALKIHANPETTYKIFSKLFPVISILYGKSLIRISPERASSPFPGSLPSSSPSPQVARAKVWT